jgi:glycosyltransferase involved in cell wall biosynthesis
MKLTICLLTRNDESKLGRCLRSLTGLAGEILVGDTGSSDGTVEKARQLQARVVSYLGAMTLLPRAIGCTTLHRESGFLDKPDEELLPCDHSFFGFSKLRKSFGD